MKVIYLRTARERLGLTQEQLEAKADVAQNTISKLERDAESRPAFDTVVKLATALGVDPMALRFGADPNKRERISA